METNRNTKTHPTPEQPVIGAPESPPRSPTWSPSAIDWSSRRKRLKDKIGHRIATESETILPSLHREKSRPLISSPLVSNTHGDDSPVTGSQISDTSPVRGSPRAFQSTVNTSLARKLSPKSPKPTLRSISPLALPPPGVVRSFTADPDVTPWEYQDPNELPMRDPPAATSVIMLLEKIANLDIVGEHPSSAAKRELPMAAEILRGAPTGKRNLKKRNGKRAAIRAVGNQLVSPREDATSPTGTAADWSPSIFPTLSRTSTNDTDITTSTRETFLEDDSEDDGDPGITAPISGTFEKHTFLGDLMKLSPKAIFDDRAAYSTVVRVGTDDTLSSTVASMDEDQARWNRSYSRGTSVPERGAAAEGGEAETYN